MRGLLVLLGLASLVAWGVLMIPRPHRVAPTISINVVEENGWSGYSTSLPGVDGYIRASSGFESKGTFDRSIKPFEIAQSFKVVASPTGRLFVLTHNIIEWEGKSSVTDCALPVESQKPDQLNWTKLDDHLRAFAYLDGSTTY